MQGVWQNLDKTVHRMPSLGCH